MLGSSLLSAEEVPDFCALSSSLASRLDRAETTNHLAGAWTVTLPAPARPSCILPLPKSMGRCCGLPPLIHLAPWTKPDLPMPQPTTPHLRPAEAGAKEHSMIKAQRCPRVECVPIAGAFGSPQPRRDDCPQPSQGKAWAGTKGGQGRLRLYPTYPGVSQVPVRRFRESRGWVQRMGCSGVLFHSLFSRRCRVEVNTLAGVGCWMLNGLKVASGMSCT